MKLALLFFRLAGALVLASCATLPQAAYPAATPNLPTASSAPTQVETPTASTGQVYIDPGTGIQIGLPPGWTVDPQGGQNFGGPQGGFAWYDNLGTQRAYSLDELCAVATGRKPADKTGFQRLEIGGDPACLAELPKESERRIGMLLIAHPLADGRQHIFRLGGDLDHLQAIGAAVRWPADPGFESPSCTPEALPEPTQAILDAGLTVESYPVDDCPGNNAVLEGVRLIPAAALDPRSAWRVFPNRQVDYERRSIQLGQDQISAHLATQDPWLAQVERNGEEIYHIQITPQPYDPIANLVGDGAHWYLETPGSVIVDGVALNETHGYTESFGVQILAGKPFYFFRKGEGVGFAYAGKEYPDQFDRVDHNMCCSGAVYNPLANESMITFFALKDGMRVYVEAGVYGEQAPTQAQ